MTLAGLSLLMGLKAAPKDAAANTGASPDGADAFAVMMADLGKPSLPVAPGEGGKDAPSLHAKDDDDAQSRDDKDKGTTQDDSDAALMTMLGVPLPLTPPAPQPVMPSVDTAAKGDTSTKGQDVPLSTVATATIPAPAASLDATPAPTAPVADPTPPVDPHLVVAALEPQTKADGTTKVSLSDQNAKPQLVQDTPAPATDTPAPATDKPAPVTAQPSATPPKQIAVATPTPQPTPVAQPVTPKPLPSTAALMAARAVTVNPATPAETRAPAAPTRKAAKDEDAAQNPDLDPTAAPAPAGAHFAAAPKSATVSPADNAGQALAAGTADRHLDLAKQGAWLDGLARDIASTGASTGTVRFQVSPQHLGTVQVEMKRGDDGAAVTLTATNEASRVALSDARPQLIAEARAHGIHISNAQVDVGTGDTSSNRDSQQQSSPRHDDSRSQQAAGNGGFSSQSGGGSDAGQRSQTRSQPLAEYQGGATRTGRGAVVGNTPVSTPATPADARYA